MSSSSMNAQLMSPVAAMFMANPKLNSLQPLSNHHLITIPASVRHGQLLQTKNIISGLNANKNVSFAPNEFPLFHYCNQVKSNLFISDETEHCIIMTSQRLMKIEYYRIEEILVFDEMIRVEHQVNGKLRWDKLIGHYRNGTMKSVGICTTEVTAFFCQVIREVLNGLAIAAASSPPPSSNLLAAAARQPPPIPQGGSNNPNPTLLPNNPASSSLSSGGLTINTQVNAYPSLPYNQHDDSPPLEQNTLKRAKTSRRQYHRLDYCSIGITAAPSTTSNPSGSGEVGIDGRRVRQFDVDELLSLVTSALSTPPVSLNYNWDTETTILQHQKVFRESEAKKKAEKQNRSEERAKWWKKSEDPLPSPPSSSSSSTSSSSSSTSSSSSIPTSIPTSSQISWTGNPPPVLNPVISLPIAEPVRGEGQPMPTSSIPYYHQYQQQSQPQVQPQTPPQYQANPYYNGYPPNPNNGHVMGIPGGFQ